MSIRLVHPRKSTDSLFLGCGRSFINFLDFLPDMSKITEKMITECYEAFRSGNKGYVPQDMNPTSAKMNMIWLDSLINTFKPYHRSGSLMQYGLILEKIKQDYGVDRARKAAESAMPYCLQMNKQSHISILERYIKE